MDLHRNCCTKLLILDCHRKEVLMRDPNTHFHEKNERKITKIVNIIKHTQNKNNKKRKL